MRVLMSEKMLEELVSDVEIGIDYNPDVHQEWCDEAHEALGNILAELRSLRAECEAAKARQVPNVDSLVGAELNDFIRSAEAIKRYAYLRSDILLRPNFGGLKDKMARLYAALPTWAKFREE